MKTYFLAVVMILAVCLPARADSVVLTNIPAYNQITNNYIYSCGPVAGAMIFGFCAMNGYTNLFKAQGTNLLTESNVTNEIFQIAVCLNTTSNNGTLNTMIIPGITNYAKSKGYIFAVSGANFTTNTSKTTTWTSLTNEICAGRPMIFWVDLDGNGNLANHFVPVFGYSNNIVGDKFYACYTTYTNVVSWYKLQGKASENIYGVSQVFQIIPGALPAPTPKRKGMVVSIF